MNIQKWSFSYNHIYKSATAHGVSFGTVRLFSADKYILILVTFLLYKMISFFFIPFLITSNYNIYIIL